MIRFWYIKKTPLRWDITNVIAISLFDLFMKQFDTWKCFCVFYTELIKLIFVLVQKHPWPIRLFFSILSICLNKCRKIHIFNILGKHKEIYRDRKTCIYFLLRGLCDSSLRFVTKYSLSSNCFEGLRVVCDFFWQEIDNCVGNSL